MRGLAWKLHKQQQQHSNSNSSHSRTHTHTHSTLAHPYSIYPHKPTQTRDSQFAAEWLRLFSTRYSNNVFGLFKFLSYSNSSNNNNNNNGNCTRQAMQMPQPAACISYLPVPLPVPLPLPTALPSSALRKPASRVNI